MFVGFQFCKESVLDSYEHFIENFAKAEKLLDDVSSKSVFQRFAEVPLQKNSKETQAVNYENYA